MNLDAIPYSFTAFAVATWFFTLETAIRYAIIVSLSFAVWWWWQRRPQRYLKIQAKLPQGRQVWREAGYSLLSLGIFGAVVPVMIACGSGHDFAFYDDINTHGWAYYFFSIVLMMLIQDTWFYWSHRLMHHRALFRFFHRTHHLSLNPTPLSTYTISPLEAVGDAMPTVFILFFVPKAISAYLIFLWLNTAYAVYGHLGYEIFPRGFSEHWLGRWINTSVAHNTHHAKGCYNYGWYFLFWDRLMGTLDPAYDERYREAKGMAIPEIRKAA